MSFSTAQEILEQKCHFGGIPKNFKSTLFKNLNMN